MKPQWRKCCSKLLRFHPYTNQFHANSMMLLTMKVLQILHSAQSFFKTHTGLSNCFGFFVLFFLPYLKFQDFATSHVAAVEDNIVYHERCKSCLFHSHACTYDSNLCFFPCEADYMNVTYVAKGKCILANRSWELP